MSTITREQLRERARQKIKSLEFAVTQTAFADSRPELEEELELARIALASLEAEAVAEVCEGFTLRYIGHGPAPKSGVRIGDRLYTAPPAPVSVPDFGALTKCIVQRLVDYGAADDDAIARAEEFVYNACRAAMLQSFGNSEQLNSPVIPDGWVMVPVEPTAEMISSGIAAHYERSQIQIHDRPAPGPMECAYVAMLAAAPQQEVK
jgi:hypothetical protein